MSNIEIYANMMDGSLQPSHRKGDSCKNLVIKTIGDDPGTIHLSDVAGWAGLLLVLHRNRKYTIEPKGHCLLTV